MSTWLIFALCTVVCWGLYGLFIHTGVMALDPRNDPDARFKAFLFVGLAYFLTAVLAPVLLLLVRGADWSFMTNVRGVSWSLLAGIVGAAGAFFVLLALAAAGNPQKVPMIMSIVFAGAPIVNAIAAFISHPPRNAAGGIDLSVVHPVFYVGIALAACGGLLVSLFKPDASKPAATPRAADTAPAVDAG